MRGENAVVVGAGMAGLFAAQVLADFYEEVTVIERDSLPSTASPRGGAPQGRHLHVLLSRGLLAIGELFPGLVDDLVAAGVPGGDLLATGRMYFNGFRLTRTYGDLPILGVTRPYLEWRIRGHLAARRNVRIVSSCAASGLLLTSAGESVIGVRVDSGHDQVPDGVLAADLVVDASGRRSALPRWLLEAGYAPPVEERVEIDLAYASWYVHAEPDLLEGDLGLAVGTTPEVPAGGALARVQGGQWLVSLTGYRGWHPPTTVQDCLTFARHLPVPDLFDVLRHTTPVQPPVRYRVRQAMRRRFERLRRFPDGLAVIGDALCSFNPVYGQGMSVAAVQALALRTFLRGNGRPTPSLRTTMARANAVAWAMSVGSDLRMPWIDNRRTVSVRVGNAYVDRVLRTAQDDPVVARAFMRVASLVQSPSSLARPNVAMRVLARPARSFRRDKPAVANR